MSNQDSAHKDSSFWQVIFAILGSVVVFTLTLVLFAKACSVMSAPQVAESAPSNVEENIKPVAVVEVATAETGTHVDKSGAEVVQAVCSMCHAAGLMNAPKIGDKNGWKPRVAQGYDTLVSHAINGIRSMPAKGGDAALSDKEVAEAVKHMANASGASF
jgi:cytochrome c5